MTDENVSVLFDKIEALTDALNLVVGLPPTMTDGQKEAYFANKAELAVLNSEIELFHAQRELATLKG